MQDYIAFAHKKNIVLLDKGKCQFCGANTKHGIHECLEIFNLDIGIDVSKLQNHIFKFLIVDAHALQHPEIHGRWSNHFHLTRLHLIFKYDINWTYKMSPKLSNQLNIYKSKKQYEVLIPPETMQRGLITSTDILEKPKSPSETKEWIKKWAWSTYDSWDANHKVVDVIAHQFLNNSL
ncbi:DUF5946 family protein [Hyunsoonleella ulvae]|uniref:DUF5946 family protein n=1 Tax=Hyunsoonleella ulvae TaxID=2799948 RepID=UPI00193A1246|nr:DUF5946 family protein [Hyunsoonleella ulvae]